MAAGVADHISTTTELDQRLNSMRRVKFQVGDRVTSLLVGLSGVVVRTEILGEEPPPGASALGAAAHRPGALIYVVRHFGGAVPIEASYEEDEIELATAR